MDIFFPTTRVKIGGSIEATILEVLIGPNKQVQYKCSWWDGRTRTSEWLCESEVEGKYEEKKKVGFK